MFIKNCLTPINKLKVLKPSSTAREAVDLLRNNQLESVPVVGDGGEFAGICGFNTIFKQLVELKKRNLRFGSVAC